MPFYTQAAGAYGKALTEGLKGIRLIGGAGFGLKGVFWEKKSVAFSPSSWPKAKKENGEFPLSPFEIKPLALNLRTKGLLKALWMSRFIFLEVLWEEYLQDVVLELRGIDVTIFEPFCERKFMTDVF